MFKLVLQVLHCQSHHTVHGHLIPHCPRLLFTFWQRRKSKIIIQRKSSWLQNSEFYSHSWRIRCSSDFSDIKKMKCKGSWWRFSLLFWSEKQMSSKFLWTEFWPENKLKSDTDLLLKIDWFFNFFFQPRSPFPSVYCCHWLCSSFCLPKLFRRRH